MISDQALERYSRQILLPGLDLEGQEKLSQSRVAVIGCGGLGCVIALYLAGAGVGYLELVDDDVVEISNLHRQVAFVETDLGSAKAEALAHRCRQLNSTLEIIASPRRFALGQPLDRSLAASVDLMIDASDSVDTRLAIEALTREASTPWIMASAAQLAGQWVAFDASRSQACYRCLIPHPEAQAMGDCERHGVLGPVVGMIASMSALQAIEFLGMMKAPHWGVLHYFDAQQMELRSMPLSRSRNCPACHTSAIGV